MDDGGCSFMVCNLCILTIMNEILTWMIEHWEKNCFVSDSNYKSVKYNGKYQLSQLEHVTI